MKMTRHSLHEILNSCKLKGLKQNNEKVTQKTSAFHVLVEEIRVCYGFPVNIEDGSEHFSF